MSSNDAEISHKLVFYEHKSFLRIGRVDVSRLKSSSAGKSGRGSGLIGRYDKSLRIKLSEIGVF